MFVDVHCHLDDEKFNDLNSVINNAKANGVKAIISNGINYESNLRTLEIAEKYSIVKPALGLYPLEALKLTDSEIKEELEFITRNKKKIIAIGEVGIDYHYSNEKERQKKIFLEVIELSEKLKLPLIIHSRKAEQDVVDLLKSSNVKKAVMHSFTGKLKIAKEIIDHNWSFSIPLIIKKASNFKRLVEISPISNLLTETDSPYLGISEKINEPSNVVDVVKEISLIKKLNSDETKNLIFMNFQRIFSK